MLQNGQMPAFLGENILQQVVSPTRSTDPCIFQLKRGLQMLGISTQKRPPNAWYALCHPTTANADGLSEDKCYKTTHCPTVATYLKAKVF